MTTKLIELHDHERIIAVVPDKVKGSGYSNAPTWVYIHSPLTGYREECIQPDERSEELETLFDIGALVSMQLIKAVDWQVMK